MEKELEMESGWEERMVWEMETEKEKERVLEGKKKKMEKGQVWEQKRWMLRRSGKQRGAHRFCPLFFDGWRRVGSRPWHGQALKERV